MPNVERRISAIQFEFRASKDGKSIEGFAATYGKLSSPIGSARGAGTYRERIQRGAFANAVNSKQDVVMLKNHDVNQVLGRTTAGTLRLADTCKGLRFHCDLPNTNSANELHESIRVATSTAVRSASLLANATRNSTSLTKTTSTNSERNAAPKQNPARECWCELLPTSRICWTCQ